MKDRTPLLTQRERKHRILERVGLLFLISISEAHPCPLVGDHAMSLSQYGAAYVFHQKAARRTEYSVPLLFTKAGMLCQFTELQNFNFDTSCALCSSRDFCAGGKPCICRLFLHVDSSNQKFYFPHKRAEVSQTLEARDASYCLSNSFASLSGVFGQSFFSFSFCRLTTFNTLLRLSVLSYYCTCQIYISFVLHFHYVWVGFLFLTLLTSRGSIALIRQQKELSGMSMHAQHSERIPSLE